jgi:cellobiose phosphorylase
VVSVISILGCVQNKFRNKPYVTCPVYIRMKKNTIKIRNSQNNYGKLYVFNYNKLVYDRNEVRNLKDLSTKQATSGKEKENHGLVDHKFI